MFYKMVVLKTLRKTPENIRRSIFLLILLTKPHHQGCFLCFFSTEAAIRRSCNKEFYENLLNEIYLLNKIVG